MTGRPRLERDPVEMPLVFGPLAAVWDAVCALADALNKVPWTIVGGQMVYLLGVEHGARVHRISTDIDAAVDLRTAPGGVKALVAVLTGFGFESAGPSPDGHAYRYERHTAGGVGAVIADQEDDQLLVVDVLAPEGPPSRPLRHRVDLAFLCGLVADPFTLSNEVDKTDRKRLRAAYVAFAESDRSWGGRPPTRPTPAAPSRSSLETPRPAEGHPRRPASDPRARFPDGRTRRSACPLDARC